MVTISTHITYIYYIHSCYKSSCALHATRAWFPSRRLVLALRPLAWRLPLFLVPRLSRAVEPHAHLSRVSSLESRRVCYVILHACNNNSVCVYVCYYLLRQQPPNCLNLTSPPLSPCLPVSLSVCLSLCLPVLHPLPCPCPVLPCLHCSTLPILPVHSITTSVCMSHLVLLTHVPGFAVKSQLTRFAF